MTIDQLTADDYLYFEALADSELLDAGETGDFLKLCEQFVQHQDISRFVGDIMVAAPIELRDAREIADAIKMNVLNSGQPVPGTMATPTVQSTPQVRIPAQQGRVTIPAQQSRPAMSAPQATAPQSARELPKMPIGFTAFGPLAATQAEGQTSGTPQISVYSQKTISAPSAAVFPSSQNKSNQPNQAPSDAAPSKPSTPKSYEKGKDPYREALQ